MLPSERPSRRRVKICFITDGGLQAGMGHVQQSTTFARELRANADITFLTKSDETVLAAIREAEFRATGLRSDAEIFHHLEALNPAIVIFDKLDVEERLAGDIKRALQASLVIFTNLTEANKYADIAVTAGIGSDLKNVTYTDKATNTRYYYGPRYWVLRREFYEFKRMGKTPSRKPERILLIFGGSDPLNLTSVVLEKLLNIDQAFLIDVILGAHFSHDEFLNQILGRYSSKRPNVAIHRNIQRVAELMYKADLAIASPGLSMYEALCVGTPVIVMPQNEMQRTYQQFMKILERDNVEKLADMIDRADFIFPHDSLIAQMEIGEGVHELIDVIMQSTKNEWNKTDRKNV